MSKFALILFIAFTTSILAFGQELSHAVAAPGEVVAAEPARVEISKSINQENLRTHLTILASDEYEGRETGEKGQKMAAEYIADFFEGIGLKPGNGSSFLQPFEVSKSGWGDVYIEANGTQYKFLEDFYGWPGSNGNIDFSDNEFVFCGFGIDDPAYSDYDGVDVNGKLVLIMAGEPEKNGIYLLTGTEEHSNWVNDWKAKLSAAKKNGAEALLVLSKRASSQLKQKSFVNYLADPDIELSGAEESIDLINNMYITREMAEGLMAGKTKKIDKAVNKINSKGKPRSMTVANPVKFHVEKTRESLTTENVIGMIEGTDLKNEVIVLSAHYDHIGKNETEIFNGADDDGSGTVSVMEIARAMSNAKKAGKGPRRTILFMTVSGEEKGLLGSEYYTDYEPIIPLDRIVANLNIDMVGRIDAEHEADPDYVYTIGSDFLSTDLHRVHQLAASQYSDLTIDYRYNNTDDPNRYYYRSDHYNFAKNGIPVIFYFNGTHEDYHGAGDTVDKIAFDVMEKRARLVFQTLWELANMDKAPAVDKSLE